MVNEQPMSQIHWTYLKYCSQHFQGTSKTATSTSLQSFTIPLIVLMISSCIRPIYVKKYIIRETAQSKDRKNKSHSKSQKSSLTLNVNFTSNQQVEVTTMLGLLITQFVVDADSLGIVNRAISLNSIHDIETLLTPLSHLLKKWN